MIKQLPALFQQHASALQVKDTLIKEWWQEINTYYTQSHRAYHNLQHLSDLFNQLEQIENKITNLPAIQMAIWYHDIIYNPLKKNNEEKSADLASERLSEAGIENHLLQKIHTLIISTKSHHTENWTAKEEKRDNDYLLDMDLSILGRHWDNYREYTQQIRQEYKVVPGILYRRGRKKVLRHFLEQSQIYKTKNYQERYEANARSNMKKELRSI